MSPRHLGCEYDTIASTPRPARGTFCGRQSMPIELCHTGVICLATTTLAMQCVSRLHFCHQLPFPKQVVSSMQLWYIRAWTSQHVFHRNFPFPEGLAFVWAYLFKGRNLLINHIVKIFHHIFGWANWFSNYLTAVLLHAITTPGWLLPQPVNHSRQTVTNHLGHAFYWYQQYFQWNIYFLEIDIIFKLQISYFNSKTFLHAQLLKNWACFMFYEYESQSTVADRAVS